MYRTRWRVCAALMDALRAASPAAADEVEHAAERAVRVAPTRLEFDRSDRGDVRAVARQVEPVGEQPDSVPGLGFDAAGVK